MTKHLLLLTLCCLSCLLSPRAAIAEEFVTPTTTVELKNPVPLSPLDPPTLTASTHTTLRQKVSRLVNIIQRKPIDPILTVTNNQDNEVISQTLNPGIQEIKIPLDKLSPGEFSISLDSQPVSSFYWGVLALNTDQAEYHPKETIVISAASLNSGGHTLCDSNLQLTLGNSNYPLNRNSTCGKNNVTDQPDYSYTLIAPPSPGSYSLTLTNLDTNYSVSKSITVNPTKPFTLKRSGATRINPFKSDYVMTIQITAHTDLAGQLQDHLPLEFTTLNPTSWDLNLKAGESTTLSYRYRAPEVSPELYTLGPLTFGDNSVPNIWSIAADATFSMQTGYYMGDGTDDRAITGIGFQPELVFIQGDAPSGGDDGVLFKTSAMSGETTAKLSDNEADVASNNIQSLDSNGFTIGSDDDVNATNVRFVWVAFSGSDCTSSGTFCVGSYTGNGSTPRSLTSTGFQPNLVIIKNSSSTTGGVFRTSDMGTNATNGFGFINESTIGTESIRSLDSTGFTLGNDARVNTSSVTYWFIAFKTTSGAFTTGTFTGNGTSQSISGLGFQPDYVWVKNSNATTQTIPYFNQPESNGNHSGRASNGSPQTARITSLDSDGFSVGSDATINENTKTIYWFAFAGSAAQSPQGTYSFSTGTFTGNGTSQSISGLGFQPDLVIIKHDSAANQGVFRTRLMKGDTTAYFAAATANFTGGITSLDSDGFSVGSDATVNTSSSTYHYQAFGNAFNPEDNSGAADFTIGTFSGNALDDRDILRLPFQPDLVTIKGVGATLGVWRTSNHSGDLASFFNNLADTSNHLQAFNTDGFEVGTNSRVNNNNIISHWFAFKSSTTMKVSSYSGTASSQNITSAGFQPQLVWVKNSGSAVNGVFRPDTIVGDSTVYFTNSASVTDRITGMLSNGFSIGGNRTETNTASTTYQYAAWRQNSAPSAPGTPYAEGASNPTGIVDLTPEFSAVHSDSDADPAVHYEIEVNTASNFSGTVMWDTGQTSMSSLASGQRSTDVSYAGTSLSYNGTTYYWRIRFWDNKGAVGSWSSTQNFSTNSVPGTPSLDSPADTATNQSTTPALLTTATDSNSDYLRYKIELCENVGMTTNCQTFDQTSSQTGWSGQNTQTNTAYTSSTQATYTIQSALSNSFTYYWRSYTIDPGGSNTWSSTQGSPYSFTTSAAPGGSASFSIEGINLEGISLN